jgi:hypothetical protein
MKKKWQNLLPRSKYPEHVISRKKIRNKIVFYLKNFGHCCRHRFHENSLSTFYRRFVVPVEHRKPCRRLSRRMRKNISRSSQNCSTLLAPIYRLHCLSNWNCNCNCIFLQTYKQKRSQVYNFRWA